MLVSTSGVEALHGLNLKHVPNIVLGLLGTVVAKAMCIQTGVFKSNLDLRFLVAFFPKEITKVLAEH